MFQTLLTPLRAQFSPRSPSISAVPQDHFEADDQTAAEDFARDVLIELMRNSVENLKMADTPRVKSEILSEVQRIMLQDACTKDVFREMDGFLVLMSVLSTVQDHSSGSGNVVEPEEQVLKDTGEITRFVFMILSQAMQDHRENAEYFRTRVGYESLTIATRGLLTSKTQTAHSTFGLLLSLSLHDFSLSSIFAGIQNGSSTESQEDAVDAKIREFEERLGTIREPGAISVMSDLVSHLPENGGEEEGALRYAVFKLFEVLSRVSHRNQAVLSSLGLVRSVFARFSSPPSSSSQKERHVLQKLLRRLLDMGATTLEARPIFQKALRDGESLDPEILDVIRLGMRSRWMEHFSMEQGARLVFCEEMRGLPSAGFTFMTWIWVAELPAQAHTLFDISVPSLELTLVKLSLKSDGKLELSTSANPEPVIFKSKLRKGRWIHVSLVHYPHRVSNPSIRLFVDGVFVDGCNWPYPRHVSGSQKASYTTGDASAESRLSWCIASAYFLSTPLVDDLSRIIHHLGPRYSGNFQDPYFVKFLTYEASTSLNMFLSNLVVKKPSPAEIAPLIKAVKGGLGIAESSIVFSFSASQAPKSGHVSTAPLSMGRKNLEELEVQGDVFAVKAACLDSALWKIGGAAVALQLVRFSNSPHELSRSLGILTDGLRNNWQNSEDMERCRGYDILADLLRVKAHMINLTGFETIFEFLGVNSRLPEQSTIVNTVAYRAVALDFELWSRTRPEIQTAHLEHFTTLLKTSRYKTFNVKQRLSKLGLVRRLLFVLQLNWYSQTALPHLLEALKVVWEADFSKEDAIKPLTSFLAANLHEDMEHVAVSPGSVVTTHYESKNSQEKAERILDLLISTLSVKEYYTKFISALPLTRICLLLLGDRPSAFVATQILNLIGVSINISPSFTRKFELVSGWNVLKTVLPFSWDFTVNEAAFGVLMGLIGNVQSPRSNVNVSCPYIFPAILSALQTGLASVAGNAHVLDEVETSSHFSWETESTVEVMIEEMINLQSSTPTFRQIFKSQQTTQILVDAYKAFVAKIASISGINRRTSGILEKLTHFSLALALDNAISGGQKREILDTIRAAEDILHPSGAKTQIDPSLIIDNRSMRQRIASARFSMQVGERTIIKTITRMAEWRKTIQASEKKRFRKNILDLREHRRQIARLQEWTHLLVSERGLWPTHEVRLWRLDETEGPHRIRKKLEPQNEKSSSSRVEAHGQSIRDVQPPDSETQSLLQVEVPPWAESYEISSTEIEDRQLAEDIVDDKLRRVRHELEPGDVIEGVATVARVVGVDSSPGLLIMGRTHIYMLDGVVENDDGEVIDAHDAPKRMLFVPGSMVELDGPQRAQRWSYDQIVAFSNKKFLFRDVALEIYFKDSRSLFVVFLDSKRRGGIDQRLSAITVRNYADQPLTANVLRTPLFGKISTKVLSGFREDELSTATRKWQTREISNFTYLSILNQISGRTRSDATQYPIFPWVLQDYSSQTLDLLSPDSYRDLTKPMGALTAARREAAQTRYDSLQSVGEQPFHYGTHFSSSMIVCHYMIRLAPFTNMFKTLQGGDWDLPDRLFSDLSRAYESAAHDVRGDVRELIPEFFTCPEFLENAANLDFGVQQSTGEKIDDVKLPPWARGDPLLFVILNRRALESSYVSEHLPAWIDLIWGCKQRDEASLNVFHPLSYEGSIDLDSIQDDLEREAMVGIIHNFGQTPRKLFSSPHPERFNHGLSSLPLGILHGIEEDPHLLIQGSRCFKDLGPTVSVHELIPDLVAEKMIPCPEGVLCVPMYPHEQIEWKKGNSELRVVIDHKVVQVIEDAFCNCAAFADHNNLITGSSDYTVRLWRMAHNLHHAQGSNVSGHLALSHILRVHTDEVICVTASRTWSLIVSGSKDGSAALWDLNRGVYVRSIWHREGTEEAAVTIVAINESTGYIATCSRLKLCLHTINARPIATLDLTTTSSFTSLVPTITSLAFHEREYSYLGVLATGGPDGTITLRAWTADGTPEGEKARWEFVTIRTMKVRQSPGVHRPPSVTALRFFGENLYHGEETGKSYIWSLPD